jgi:hypothetical protein
VTSASSSAYLRPNTSVPLSTEKVKRCDSIGPSSRRSLSDLFPHHVNRPLFGLGHDASDILADNSERQELKATQEQDRSRELRVSKIPLRVTITARPSVSPTTRERRIY